MSEEDCIAAISTALGEASIGIVRVSGEETAEVVAKVFRTPSGKIPRLASKRKVYYGHVVDPGSLNTSDAIQMIDECLLVWMPGPRSYTGENVAELQVHGGLQVVQSVLKAVLSAGARLAEPGEFTKRAFLRGRIDLSQAEAVMDLIRAKTEMASRAALAQVKGQFSDRVRDLRKQLIRLQALVEVTIDYPEHDVEDAACDEVVRVGSALGEQVAEWLATARMGRVLREGVATVIVGRPNVGKSSLLNALLKRDRAIVTEIPGTTRDVLEEFINIQGIPFRVIDTAGIRETADVVERIGVERSREMMMDAELVLVVLNGNEDLTEEDEVLLREAGSKERIVVVNKSDLPRKLEERRLQEFSGISPVVRISAKEWDGLTALEKEMATRVMESRVPQADVSYVTNARQAQLLQAALNDLQDAVEAAKIGSTLDVIAVQLQSAYANLGLVIGEEVGEDLLDEIFSQFCLGK